MMKGFQGFGPGFHIVRLRDFPKYLGDFKGIIQGYKPEGNQWPSVMIAVCMGVENIKQILVFFFAG